MAIYGYIHESSSDETRARAIDKAILIDPNDDLCNLTDGNHSFEELYYHRMILTAALFSLVPDKCWKTKQQDNGPCPEGYFLVGIETPEGQATYHYKIEYWNLFDSIKEIPVAPTFDGHTADVAIERIKNMFIK